MTRTSSRRISYVIRDEQESFGGHLLGVNSLALDTTTVVNAIPEGILYSAGRDGMIAGWDLHLKDVQSQNRKISRANGHHRRPSSLRPEDEGAKAKSTPLCYTQAHSDWVNDIIVCHNGQSIISASNDQTVKLWQPYHQQRPAPFTIGTHLDYIKCLAHAKDTNWVASGGFDRKIHFWDIVEGIGRTVPILTIPEISSKGSIYALGCNPSGSVLASGSPERVVRVWDPRSGTRITKFSGHTDNIRDILVSHDGKHILTCSSDTTIKLWSLTAQRCINTFTMHSESVWSLYSTHPDLLTFYAADRGGLVTKTEIPKVSEITDGECVAMLREGGSVNSVVALQDQHVWTATSSSNIHKWRDIPPRSTRVQQSYSQAYGQSHGSHGPNSFSSSLPSSPPPTFEQHSGSQGGSPGILSPSRLGGIPPESTIRIISEDLYAMQTATLMESEVSTLYSVASVLSMPANLEVGRDSGDDAVPLREDFEEEIQGTSGLVKHSMLNDRRHVLTVDSKGIVDLWDIIKCTKIKSFGKRSMDDVEQELHFVDSVAMWCDVDTRIGALTVHLSLNRCFDAETYADQAGLENALDIRDDQRINLGKWILRNIFDGFVNAELDMANEMMKKGSKRPQRISFRREYLAPGARVAPEDATPTPHTISRVLAGSLQTPGLNIGLATPAPLTGALGATGPAVVSNGPADYFSLVRDSNGASEDANTTTMSATAQPQTPMVASEKASSPPTSPTKTFLTDDAASEKSKKSDSDGSNSANVPPPSPTTPGSSTLMGRLKQLGVRKPKSPSVDKGVSAEATTVTSEPSVPEETVKTLEEVIESALLPPFSPSSSQETPLLDLPSHVLVIIEEEPPALPEPTTTDEAQVKAETLTQPVFAGDLYRGTVGSMYHDCDAVESASPGWLLTYLLKNEIPQKEPMRLSFLLKPYPNVSRPMPEMPNGNTRLTANRLLRVKKILVYIATKLEEKETEEVDEPDWLEVMCHDTVLDRRMTLASIRQHIWKQGGPDVVLYYRQKEGIQGR